MTDNMYFGRPRSPRAYKIPRINRYSNPYFNRRAAPKKSAGFYYGLILLGLTLAAWVYFLFASGIFRIIDWEINGLKQYEKGDIAGSLDNFFKEQKFLLFKSSNIFLFDKNSFEKHLSDNFIFKNIDVKKYYPHKIIITLEEKQEKTAIYNGNKIFVVADDGTIIREKEGIDGWYKGPDAGDTDATSTIPASVDIEKIITDAKTKDLLSYPIFCDAYYPNKNLTVGTAYPAYKVLNIINKFIENTESRTPVKIKLVALYKNQINPKIIIYTDNNWKIYLNNADDGLKQFYKFYVTFNDKIKDINKPLEYVDLRFGDRVYIK